MFAERKDWHVNYQMSTQLGKQAPHVWFVSRWEVGRHGWKGRKFLLFIYFPHFL